MQVSSSQRMGEEEMGNDDLVSTGWYFYGVLWGDEKVLKLERAGVCTIL